MTDIDYILSDLSEVHIIGMRGVDSKIALKIGEDEKVIRKHLRGEKLTFLFQGKITEDEYWEMFIKDGNYAASKDLLKSIIRANFTIVPGTFEVFQKIKEAGYPIGMLSDHTREWVAHFEDKPFMQKTFDKDKRVYSFDSGFIKRQPQSFQYALKYLSANPERTLFIDDLPSNLEIAKSVGIAHTCLFTDAPSLHIWLRERGILNGN